MTNTQEHKSFAIITGTAILLAGFIAYSNSMRNEFVWDDASSILLHRHIQDPSKFFQLFREDLHAFGRGKGNFYRPLLAATFMLDYAIAKPQPGEKLSPLIFHITNTAWHIAAALLLAAVLRRLKTPMPVNLLVPLLYVVHPLHTQAVTYISGRGDPMAATFMYAALWFALWNTHISRNILGAILCCLCFIAAVLSKESAIVLPFLLLLILISASLQHETPKPHKTKIIHLVLIIGVFVLALIYAYLRTTLLRFETESQPVQTSFPERLIDALKALAVYTRLIFIPTGLHMERTLDGLGIGTALLGLASFLIILIATVFSLYTKHYRIFTGLAWFLITWFPISGIIPLNAQIAEHWMYVPLAGILWAIIEVIWLLIQNRPLVWKYAAGIIAYLIILAGIYGTAERNLAWKTNETIYRDTLEKNPKAIRVHFNLAVTYEDILKNPYGARRHYEKVLELYEEKKTAHPDQQNLFWIEELEAHLSLGRIYSQWNNLERATYHFGAVLRVEPNDNNRTLLAEASFGLGKCYQAIGDFDSAQKLFEQASKLNPEIFGQPTPSTSETDTSQNKSALITYPNNNN